METKGKFKAFQTKLVFFQFKIRIIVYLQKSIASVPYDSSIDNANVYNSYIAIFPWLFFYNVY